MAPKDIKHLDTEKGYILRAIVGHGAKTLDEIKYVNDMLSFEQWTDLHILLGELIQEGDVVFKEGKYSVRPALEADYSYYEENIHEWLEPPEEWEYPEDYQEPEQWYPDIIGSVKSWLKLEKPEIWSRKDHFFLEGHFLDTFTKFIINQAFKTIIVVNPFIDRSTPTQLLRKARLNGKTVVVVTRNPKGSFQNKVHQWLEKAGITMLYHKDIHAKIIIVDDALAVVSSMNFLKNATAGTSWEAGIVTIDQETVDSVKASITDLNLGHEP